MEIAQMKNIDDGNNRTGLHVRSTVLIWENDKKRFRNERHTSTSYKQTLYIYYTSKNKLFNRFETKLADAMKVSTSGIDAQSIRTLFAECDDNV